MAPKKETKEEREARQERMRTAPARQRALADEYHRQRTEREQLKQQKD
jgi:hypothetical protein